MECLAAGVTARLGMLLIADLPDIRETIGAYRQRGAGLAARLLLEQTLCRLETYLDPLGDADPTLVSVPCEVTL